MPNFEHQFVGSDRNVLVIRLPERLNHITAESLTEDARRHLPNREDAGLVLDCTDVELITSIGIASLLQISEHCHDRHAPLVLANLSEALRTMLEMLKLAGKFRAVDEVDEGVAMVEGLL